MRWRFSHFSDTGPPTIDDSQRDSSIAVSIETPSRSRRASRMSASETRGTVVLMPASLGRPRGLRGRWGAGSSSAASRAESPTRVSSARCCTTAFSTAANGTAISAPGMPATITPRAIATITPSGCTETNRPIRNGCRTCASICCTITTPASISTAVTGPCATSATSTATVPETNAPIIGTNAPMNTSTPIANTRGTPRIAAMIITPIASVPATSTVARTNWVSERHPTRPDESTRSRAARGNSRTNQVQISGPSARKK